jgi:signal transduction histidine kinase
MKRPHPIKWLHAHPLVTDGPFALLLATAAGFSSTSFENGKALDSVVWWWTALAAGSVLPLVARRVRPASTLVAVVTLQVVSEFLAERAVEGQPGALADPAVAASSAGWLGVLVACYSLGAHAAPRDRRFVAGCALATAATFIATMGIVDGSSIGEASFAVIAFVGLFAIGDNMRQRRERVTSLAERVERAEREQELLARQRVTEERTRIAREMHDVVAHSVSMMTIQAAAARRQLERNPDRAAEALTTIETTGRTAMDEMRRILGVLRTEGFEQPYSPQPSLASLPDLLAADHQLPISAVLDGDVDSVPASTQLAAYRLVQEALTNIRRHAGPVRQVTVTTQRSPGGLAVEVTDDGRGAGAPRSADGFGLVGMRERVTIANGTLQAGPMSGGGWRVAANFNLNGAGG